MRGDTGGDWQHVPSGERPRREFLVDGRRVTTCLVIAFLTGVVSLLMIAGGLLMDFPEPVINKRVMIAFVGGIGLVLAAILFVANWKKRGQRVVVSPEGFRFLKGGHWSDVRWDDITAVRLESSTFGSAELTETNFWVEVKQSQSIYLTSFFLEMATLADIILNETAIRLIPAKWSQLESGQTLIFGSLTVAKTELESAGTTVSWGDVQEVRAVLGTIQIFRKDDGRAWSYSPIKNMPNFHVFLALADKLLP